MTFAKFPKIHGALMRAIDAYARDVSHVTVSIREPGIVLVAFQKGGKAQAGEFSVFLESGDDEQVRREVGNIVRTLMIVLDRNCTPTPPGPGAAWSHAARRIP